MTPARRERSSKRIDLLLVERGLAPSREKAQALILAGLVSAGGRRVEKAGAAVPLDAELAIAATARFVGRGGEKLDGALEALGLDVASLWALDVGASTGGFTDCLLQRGACHVVALDVGRGQLDWSLRNDPRVTVVEGVNVRYLDPSSLPAPFDLIVVDVSFISLRLVLPALAPLLGRSSGPLPAALTPPAATPSLAKPTSPAAAPSSAVRPPSAAAAPPGAATASAPPPSPGDAPGTQGAGNADHPAQPPLPAIVALVKPQFEVGRGQVGKGGIVRDPALHLEALLGVLRPLLEPGPDAAGDAAPLAAWRILESPIRGAEGNREFFVYLVPGYDRPWTEVEDEARWVAAGPVSPQ